MIVGSTLENRKSEQRISVTPEIVKKYKSLGLDVYLTKDYAEKTAEGIVLDNLGLTRMCCRRHMLTHVDIE